MRQATFKMAFTGKRSKLAEKMDVSSSGLLTKLLDKQIINRRQYQQLEVSA